MLGSAKKGADDSKPRLEVAASLECRSGVCALAWLSDAVLLLIDVHMQVHALDLTLAVREREKEPLIETVSLLPIASDCF